MNRKALFGWAMFDFANSGYTTVVLTTLFNTYFVAVVAADSGHASATFLWTLIIAIANGLVLISAPIIGAIADYSAAKKRYLVYSTVICVLSTAALATVHSGDIWLASLLIVISCIAFHSGENLIAAFLPEIATPETMGRVSAYGWSLGYLGGLLILGICLVYVDYAQALEQSAEQYIPNTMLIVALLFALASLPTFLFLSEQALPQTHAVSQKKNPVQRFQLVHYAKIGFKRLQQTLKQAQHYQDLLRFLIALVVFHSGVVTVVVLATIYAQQVMAFTTQDTIKLVLLVNITAAIGAFIFGFVQDKIGAVRTLMLILLIWIAALVAAYFTDSKKAFWIIANMIGLALGSSQSAGRAIVGMFSPVERCGEFFGLWGLATKCAAIIGPLSYGLITQITDGNHKLALLSTAGFFILGLWLLRDIQQQRGMNAAKINSDYH